MWKIVFFIALWIVVVTMIIWIIRVAVYEIQLKILKNKCIKPSIKADLIEDEWKKMLKYEKEGNKKEINTWLDIYKLSLDRRKKDIFDEVNIEILKVIDGHKKNIWNEILKLSALYRKQEEEIKDKLIKLMCGDKPSLYDLWMWSIILLGFWVIWWYFYALIKFL